MLQHFDAVFAHHPLWTVTSIVLGRMYDFVGATMTIYIPYNMDPRQAASYIREHTEELERLYEEQLARKVPTHTSRLADLAQWEEDTRAMWLRHTRSAARPHGKPMGAEAYRDMARARDTTGMAPTDAEEAQLRAEIRGRSGPATTNADTWARDGMPGMPVHGASAQASSSKSTTERHQQAARGGGAGGLLSDLPWWMRADTAATRSGMRDHLSGNNWEGASSTEAMDGDYEWSQGDEGEDDFGGGDGAGWTMRGRRPGAGERGLDWESMRLDRVIGGDASAAERMKSGRTR